MKTSRGRGKILLNGINNKKSIEIVDGYYTEDGKYFIYKGKTFWYIMDVRSGLSYGKSESFVSKKDIEKEVPYIILKFDKIKSEKLDWYNKISNTYKKLCKEYDLKEGRR